MSDGAKQDPPSLDEFANRLNAARGDHAEKGEPRRATGVEVGRAMRLGSELLAGLIVGALLGLGLDTLFDTKPWLLLVGIFFGFAAGVSNVNRALKKAGPAPAQEQQPSD